MKTKRKTGPPPFKKAHKRVLFGVTLSPIEKKALDRVRGDVPFSTWARGVLMEKTKGDR